MSLWPLIGAVLMLATIPIAYRADRTDSGHGEIEHLFACCVASMWLYIGGFYLLRFGWMPPPSLPRVVIVIAVANWTVLWTFGLHLASPEQPKTKDST